MGAEYIQGNSGGGSVDFILTDGSINPDALDGTGRVRVATAFPNAIGFNSLTPSGDNRVAMLQTEFDSDTNTLINSDAADSKVGKYINYYKDVTSNWWGGDTVSEIVEVIGNQQDFDDLGGIYPTMYRQMSEADSGLSIYRENYEYLSSDTSFTYWADKYLAINDDGTGATSSLSTSSIRGGLNLQNRAILNDTANYLEREYNGIQNRHILFDTVVRSVYDNGGANERKLELNGAQAELSYNTNTLLDLRGASVDLLLNGVGLDMNGTETRLTSQDGTYLRQRSTGFTLLNPTSGARVHTTTYSNGDILHLGFNSQGSNSSAFEGRDIQIFGSPSVGDTGLERTSYPVSISMGNNSCNFAATSIRNVAILGGNPSGGYDIHSSNTAYAQHLELQNGDLLLTDGDIEIEGSVNGLILESPNGTRFRITINDDESLTTTAI